MQWSRVKTVLIFLLLAVDVFLLFYIGAHDVAARRRSAEEADNARAVLDSRGVTLPDGMDLTEEEELVLYAGRRDVEQEGRCAEAWLGETQTSQSESGVQYLSDRGMLEWSADGRLWGEVTGALEQAPTTELAQRMAEQFLQEGGVDCSGCTVTVAAQGENVQVEFTAVQDGRTVFNQRLSLLLKIDQSVEISGRWFFAEQALTQEAFAAPYSKVDVLLTATADWRDVEIEGMEPGLMLVRQSGSRVVLQPVWHIWTAQEEIYLDAESNQPVDMLA